MLILFTDTDCDMTPEVAKEYGYHLISMPYIIDEKEIRPYEDFDKFEPKKFYDMLRAGTIPSTCGLSPMTYRNYFEPHFKEGNDIFYIHFSKKMSGTFDAMKLAVAELLEEYPDRKFYTLDTKGITINAYASLIELGKMYKQGATVEEMISYGEELREHVATYFFADDLKFFARSGRVSNFGALMGNLIGIKPIIYMDQEGAMLSLSKARGTLTAARKLVDYVNELGSDIDKHPIVIGHCDCADLVEIVVNLLKEKYGNNLDITILDVNPTAGAHCGPNTLGITFHAIHR